MSAADLAHRAAVAEISTVRTEKATTLNLSGKIFRDLVLFPDEIANWRELQRLDLANTQINEVEVLSGLENLQSLSLLNTQVLDVRAIYNLPLNGERQHSNGERQHSGLQVIGTFAAALDQWSGIMAKAKNTSQRTRKILGYLKGCRPTLRRNLGWQR